MMARRNTLYVSPAVIILILLGVFIGGGVLTNKLNNIEYTQNQIDVFSTAHHTFAGFAAWYACSYSAVDVNGNPIPGCENIAQVPCGLGQTSTAAHFCADYYTLRQLQDTDDILDRTIADLQDQFDACTVDENLTCKGLAPLFDAAGKLVKGARQIAAAYGVTI